MTKVCIKCGNKFEGKKSRKYCSLKCAWSVNAIGNLPKGNNMLEIYGEDRKQQIISKRVDALKRHPKVHELAVARGLANQKNVKGKNYEEIFGLERSIEIKKKISNTLKNKTPEEMYIHGLKGALGMMKKCGTVRGRRGYVRDVRYDSSYEERFLNTFFKLADVSMDVKRADMGIKYMYDKVRMYFPDFIILLNGKVIAIVEVKDETRLDRVQPERTREKILILGRYCEEHNIVPCLYTNKHFSREYVNHEPSLLNDLIADMHCRYLEFVSRKVQRPAIEDNQSNNIAVGGLNYV